MRVAVPHSSPATPGSARQSIVQRRRSRLAAAARNALQLARDPYRLVLWALVVLTISRVHLEVSALKAARPLIVLTGAALIVAYLRPGLLAHRPLLSTWPAKAVAVLAIWACAGAPFGISFGGTATFILEDFGKTIILVFLIIASIRTPRDLYTIVLAYVVSSAWLVYEAMFKFHVEHITQNGGYYRLGNMVTYDANDLGLVLLFGLALALLIFQVSGTRGRIASGLLMLGITAAIGKSGSRGALIGLGALALGLVFLLHRVPVYKRLAVVGATVIGLTLFAPGGYWNQMATLLHPKEDYNWSSPHGRRAVALRGISYFEAYPIFGLGIGNFEKAECSPDISVHARDRLERGVGLWCEPPHNSYIQALAETGMGGIVLWLAIVPGAAVALLALRRRLPRSWETGDPEERFLYYAPLYLGVGIVAFSAGAFFLSFAWREVTFYIPAVVAGVYIAVSARLRSHPPPLAAHEPRAPLGRGGNAVRSRVRRWVARPSAARLPIR